MHLNVFAPARVRESSTALPVIVWLHGGSLVLGSGSESIYEGSALALERNVIVVTLNYRLGVFGFLADDELRSRDAERRTGNYGIQDQRMALQWVRSNIGRFGGNPMQVLLAGQGAGAGLVATHIVSPRSWGLFGSAFMMSGGFAPWTAKNISNPNNPGSPRVIWRHFLACTGCEKSVDRPACLEGHSTAALVACTPKDAFWQDTFTAVVDGVELPDYPWKLVMRGQIAPAIRVVIGSAGQDRALKIGADASFADLVNALGSTVNNDFDLTRQLLALYPPAVPKGFGSGYNGNYWAAMRAGTEASTACAARDAAHQIANEGHEVFWYEFDYVAPGTPPGHGAARGSDIPFFFRARTPRTNLSLVQSNILPVSGPRGEEVSDIISMAAANLAAGLPLDSVETGAVIWRTSFQPSYRARGSRDTVVRIGMHTDKAIDGWRREQCDFWRRTRAIVSYPPRCTWTSCEKGWPVQTNNDLVARIERWPMQDGWGWGAASIAAILLGGLLCPCFATKRVRRAVSFLGAENVTPLASPFTPGSVDDDLWSLASPSSERDAWS